MHKPQLGCSFLTSRNNLHSGVPMDAGSFGARDLGALLAALVGASRHPVGADFRSSGRGLVARDGLAGAALRAQLRCGSCLELARSRPRARPPQRELGMLVFCGTGLPFLSGPGPACLFDTASLPFWSNFYMPFLSLFLQCARDMGLGQFAAGCGAAVAEASREAGARAAMGCSAARARL